MPLYRFLCNSGHERYVLRSPKEIREIAEITCEECGEAAKRAPTGVNGATVKERIDTGYMPKRLERLADAERLFKDRNKKES